MVSTFLIYLFSYILGNAIYFAKKTFYKNILIFSLFIPMIIPSYSFIVIYRSIIEGLGGQSLFYKLFSINTDITLNESVAILSVIFVSTITLIPFTTFLIYSSFKNVKSNIVEMGKIDGLEEGESLWHILLPITFPAISLYAIFNFLKFLKNFQIPFLMSSGLPPIKQGVFPNSIVGATTNLGVFLFNKLNNIYDVSLIAAYSLAISFIILVFAFLWYIKNFIKVKRVYITFFIVFVLHLIDRNFFPLIFYFTSLFLFYRRSRYFKNFYSFAVILDISIYIIASFSQGVYNHFLISVFVSSFLILYIGLPEFDFINFMHFWLPIKYTVSILWIIFAFLPLIAIFQLSFSYRNFPPFVIPFRFDGFNNFFKLFTQENFLKNILNTFFISFFASAINIFVTFPAVIAARRMKIFKSFIYSVSIFFGIFTGIHTIVPIYKFFSNFPLFNTFVPIILMSAIHSMPMVFLILFGFLSKYDRSYDEIAIIEGCGFFQMIKNIYLPLSKSAIFLSFLYTFMQSWNSFILPLFLLNNDNLYPISIKLYNYVGDITSTYPEWNLFGAGTLLNLMVVTFIFYFLRKNSSYETYENFY
jgi:ABC-type glycerol-3-phosphate transport system permease component